MLYPPQQKENIYTNVEKRRNFDFTQKSQCNCNHIKNVNDLWNNLLHKALLLGIPNDTILLAEKVTYSLLTEDEEWTKNQLEEKKKAHGENFWLTNNTDHCQCFYSTNTALRNLRPVNPNWPNTKNELKKFIIGEINLLYKTWYYYIKYQALEKESNEEHQKLKNELRSKKKPKSDRERGAVKRKYKDRGNRRNIDINYQEDMEFFDRFQKYSQKVDTIFFLKNAHKSRIDCLLSKIFQMLSCLVELNSVQ
uniref:Uncharacterized protein n=1 Tax=Strongyloides venezuelensis TaxID=75913 RepID=A0A0K0F4I8_STRVS